MRKQEVNQIIENYRPHKGFYDLTEKPKTLTKVEYAKLLKIQEYLSWQEGNKEYLQKFEPIQWQKMKELSANYQAIVLEHWGSDGKLKNMVDMDLKWWFANEHK